MFDVLQNYRRANYQNYSVAKFKLEKLLNCFSNGVNFSQRLLIPMTVELLPFILFNFSCKFNSIVSILLLVINLNSITPFLQDFHSSFSLLIRLDMRHQVSNHNLKLRIFHSFLSSLKLHNSTNHASNQKYELQNEVQSLCQLASFPNSDKAPRQKRTLNCKVTRFY